MLKVWAMCSNPGLSTCNTQGFAYRQLRKIGCTLLQREMQNRAMILWLWKAFKLTSLIKLLLVISQNLVILLIVAAFTGLGEYSTLQLMLLQNQLLILGVLFVWNKHDIPAHSYTYTQWGKLLYFLNNKAFYDFIGWKILFSSILPYPLGCVQV